ncbi:MAG: DUF3047 domain-containing protein [Pseudomonadota bacterium]
MVRLKTYAVIAALVGSPVVAGNVGFSSGWAEQRLSLFSNNRYSFGQQLNMVSLGGVSIAYTRIPEGDWQAATASWRWAVEQSVPVTDLRRKGGDDRNLSLYFVFLPDSVAAKSKGKGIRSLLGNKDVRVLLYTWGGDHPRGARFPSPYLDGQGMNIALRQAGTGSFSEKVNLAGDYRVAFGGEPGALVGIAVSGDSDDTDSEIRAAIANLRLD